MGVGSIWDCELGFYLGLRLRIIFRRIRFALLVALVLFMLVMLVETNY
jgi:hypothetical protein